MRFALLGFGFFGCAIISSAGVLAPLTVKDVSLMLRSGYTVASVEREVAARHFQGPVDPTAEQALAQAGASSALIVALKSGSFAMAPAELAAAQEELAAKAQRRAAVEDALRHTAPSQTQPAQARLAATPVAPSDAVSNAPTSGSIAALLRGDLVTSKNGVLSPYLDQEFEKKKLIGLYFSAHWCGPCRKFTPQLVDFYNRAAAAHPDFEIVFVSRDRSASAMQDYMSVLQMPWPAIAFDKIPGKVELQKYAGAGAIPCLVVVDTAGKVVFNTYSDGKYLGPDSVLKGLDQLFAAIDNGQVVLKR